MTTQRLSVVGRVARTWSRLWPFAAAAAIALFSFTAADSALDQWTLWTIEGLLALSLTLVWGHGGIFSLGQTAFYGLGAYTFGVTTINLIDSPLGFFAGAAAAVAVAAIVAAFLAYFMFYGRVSPINVAIITLATTLVLYALVNYTADPKYRIGDAHLGGFNGLVGVPPVRIGGADALPLDRQQFFLLVAGVSLAVVLTVRWLLSRPFGRIAAAVRSNPQRAELLGYDIRLHQLKLFTLGGAIAGLAGALFAAWGSFVSPTIFALAPAILVVIWVLVGGRSQIAAAFIGVFVVEGLSHWLGGSQGQYSPIYLGAALILIVLVLPGGLYTAAQALTRRRGRTRSGDTGSAPNVGELDVRPTRHSTVLQTAGVRKDFGGLTAVAEVDLRFPATGVSCVIGPNGAGKSTLFGLLSGLSSPSAGAVLLDGRNISKVPPHRRARLGIGIKLQSVSVFPDLPVSENLWLASYAAMGHNRRATERARHVLHGLGLPAAGGILADELSHGQQQWLETGMVIAAAPAVLLLDEPTAGMSPEETRRTAELITILGNHTCVIVIEHDMAFVRQLDAPVTVMHLGAVLTHGSLRELEQDDRVLDIYLGHDHVVR